MPAIAVVQSKLLCLTHRIREQVESSHRRSHTSPLPHFLRLPGLHILGVDRLGQQARLEKCIGNLLLLTQLINRHRLHLVAAVRIGRFHRGHVEIADAFFKAGLLPKAVDAKDVQTWKP